MIRKLNAGAAVAFCAIMLLPAYVLGADSSVPAAASYSVPHLKVELINPDSRTDPSGAFIAAVRFTIEPGWHIYGQNPGDIGRPTTVKWKLPAGYFAGPIDWPAAEEFKFEGKTSYGYENTITAAAPLSITGGRDRPSAVRIGADVSWLLCKDECIPGRTALEAEFDPPTATESSLIKLLLLALAGGALLNLMPCVFPVLSLKILGLASKQERSEAIRHGGAFAGGIVLSFWILAAAYFAVRALGRQVGWGFQLQSPLFVTLMALIIFSVGLNLLGVFEVGAALQRSAGRADRHNGLMGSFLSGVLSTLLATPCSAPFMVTALSAAVAMNSVGAFMIFTALGIGMALPYLILSLLPAWHRFLPQPGVWMVRLRQILAFPMFATVVWLLWVLSFHLQNSDLIKIIWALLVLSFGFWVYGTWGQLYSASWSKTAARLVCLLNLIAAPLIALPSSAELPLDGSAAAASPGSDEAVNWEPYSASRLSDLRALNIPVLLEFTAAWCLTCQANHHLLFNYSQVINVLKEKGVVLMIGDWTRNDPAVTKAINDFGRSGVPLNVLYLPGQERPSILPQILTAGELLGALGDLPQASHLSASPPGTGCAAGPAETTVLIDKVECEKG